MGSVVALRPANASEVMRQTPGRLHTLRGLWPVRAKPPRTRRQCPARPSPGTTAVATRQERHVPPWRFRRSVGWVERGDTHPTRMQGRSWQPTVRNDAASAPSIANPSAIDERAPWFHSLGRTVAIPAANARAGGDFVCMGRLGGMDRPRIFVIGRRSIGADAAGSVRGRSALGGTGPAMNDWAVLIVGESILPQLGRLLLNSLLHPYTCQCCRAMQIRRDLNKDGLICTLHDMPHCACAWPRHRVAGFPDNEASVSASRHAAPAVRRSVTPRGASEVKQSPTRDTL
jgi:hypothetical protein